ncbi:branched-chain amino acid ABC transporter permease [Rhizobium sp. KVB221]|uniref:Branched-chain amino acid ABC transporter permease n=1 Tax=Rhizobium setariae TaxID=2801340 RepID=A0A937CL59_9HYPH|nr:branched-chain amino acid ABC transporter permease [Rhizobium setariae]MBL0371256.1 branched-chain amino acid ABC transporter permease [Rhizobium setariae]
MLTEASLAYFLQQCLNAAPSAALYAMLAFGYCLSFGLTKRVDFTPGALFAFAGQIFVLFTAFGYERLWLVYPAALGVGVVAALSYTLLASALIGAKVTRPLAAVSPNAVIIASLAVMITLMETVRLAANTREVWLSPFLNQRIVFWGLPAFPVVMTALQVVNTLVMAAIVAIAAMVLTRSAMGRNWRAVCDDGRAAELMGVNADATLVGAALVTATFSATSGILATAYYGSMDFGSGLMFGLKVVMIAAIGDQSSPAKSALGAALFGVVETFWGAYVGYIWRDLAMFSMLVLLAVLLRQERRI